MPVTPNWDINYPASTGHARTWEYWEQMALDVEAALDIVQGAIDAAEAVAANAGAITKTATDVTGRTTSSTTFTPVLTAANVVGVTFKAPLSGIVNVTVTAGMVNSGAGYSLTGYRLGAGTVIGAGTVTLAGHIDRALRTDGTSYSRSSYVDCVTGLTPGADYNVQLEHAVASGTMTVDRRGLIVTPE